MKKTAKIRKQYGKMVSRSKPRVGKKRMPHNEAKRIIFDIDHMSMTDD